ncbi:Decaprenyl diphosphate synthase-like protein [Apodospora peruviana]|uniref:Alkyl transferase n=1 Tax=Apodospora peruviana TaxID=516989 RepID=A0AAE0HXQ5_9PEZI|nr:Decaprenyl diphosphate synthase-like protein [Apodospora peruviana]
MSDLYLSRFRSWFLSSPPAEWATKRLRETVIGALRQGPIPQHVAFVMDGNRRYARSHKIETVEGHNLGFEALARVLEICYKCGVKVVTVYAFSIENYNRPKYEVDGLMQLAKLKLEQLVQHGELLERYGAGIRVLGQRDLISPDVLEVVDRAVARTKHNTKAILNICFPYTSREEITTAVRSTVEEYSTTPRPHSTPFSQNRITQKILSKQGDKNETSLSTVREASPSPPTSRPEDPDESVSSSTTLPPDSPPLKSVATENVTIYPNAENITSETLDSHMYTAECPPLDLFIRTSGVERLSDFMLWQCHQDTQIFFLKCFWPEFDLWNFLPVLVEWQWRQKQKERDEKPSRRTKQA